MASMLARNWINEKTQTARNYGEVKSYIAHGTPFKHRSCHTERDVFTTEDGTQVPVILFFSYSTVVGLAFEVRGLWHVFSTREKYSVTTSKQQGYWAAYAMSDFWVEYHEVFHSLDNIHTLHDIVEGYTK